MSQQAQAKLNELRMAPRKVRLVADLIRDMEAEEAKAQLRLSKKRASKPLLKLLNSAIANAEHNHDLDISTLTVKIAKVDEGPTMKRFKPRAFGSASPINKRSSHIKLVLEGEKSETAASPDTDKEDSDAEVTEESRKKLMRKTKDEIKEYAQEEYGIELSTDDLKKEMLDQFFEKLNQ